MTGSQGVLVDKSRRITMIDVAKAAGVSHQTVSRVINHDPRVAPETRQRVTTVIEALHYRPSRLARSLATRQSRTLAVITYDLSYYGPTQMVINIERAARAAGYDIFLANIDPSNEQDIGAVAGRIAEWSVDGALLIAPVADTHYQQMVAQLNHLAVLQIDVAPGAPGASVIIDQHQGSYTITRHLLELGHRRIAEICGPMQWHGALARHRGFEAALAEAGLAAAVSVEGSWTAESGYRAAQQIMEGAGCSAIVAANDQMALGAIGYLTQRGLQVPQDVSVVGFDDIPEAAYFLPQLTTIRQDFSTLGRTGLEYLVRLIEHPETVRKQVVIEAGLIVRASTARPRM
jgi:LacI family transcriptional regulator